MSQSIYNTKENIDQPPDEKGNDISWRDLSLAETKNMYELITKRWGFAHYWYPLQGFKPQPADIVSVWLNRDNTTLKNNILRTKLTVDKIDIEYLEKFIINLLIAKGYSRIFNFSNDNREEVGSEWGVQDLTIPVGTEEISCPAEAEWLIYTSHEGTIAFGGSWLVEAVTPLLQYLGEVQSGGEDKLSNQLKPNDKL